MILTCKRCGSEYPGDLGQCPKCLNFSAKEPADDRLGATAGSPREWRSAAFWHSDIEDIIDRIANEAMGYHPDSRAEFFRDVMEAIKEHLENGSSEEPGGA